MLLYLLKKGGRRFPRVKREPDPPVKIPVGSGGAA